MSQTEINDAMVRHAAAGRTVVRLKGGDPAIFARLAEELAALEAAGVPYEIVPGVTAAQAASSHAGIPLTDRDDASCVAFVTGQECSDKKPAEALDYAALAKFPGTLVFYMGVTTAPEWSRALIEHGKPAGTPVAIVRRCSLADQETIFTTLGELPALLQSKKAAAAGGGHRRRCGARARRLRIGSPRGRCSAGRCSSRGPSIKRTIWRRGLRKLGANVLCQPAIEICAAGGLVAGRCRDRAARRVRLARVFQQQRRAFFHAAAACARPRCAAAWAACDWPRSARPRSTRWPNSI